MLIWGLEDLKRLPKKARPELQDQRNELCFSVVSVWEVVIKSALKKKDFHVDARLMRAELLSLGYLEIPLLSQHALELAYLPRLHGDPFDRLLVAQARVEGMALFTSDHQLAGYGEPVRYFA